MSVLADTGCQACCIGPDELRKLGLSKKGLLPVDMKLNGANGSKIQILGAISVLIPGRDKALETDQLCYIAEKAGWTVHTLRCLGEQQGDQRFGTTE